MWLQAFAAYIPAMLRDFGVKQTQPTLVYEDNLACIAMSVNPVRPKHSRHIDVRRHYIRELCLGNLVKLVPLRTNLMVADALTNSLPAPGLERHRSVMMGHSDFQVRLLHAARAGYFWGVVQQYVLLPSISHGGYLNDNAFVEAILYEKKNGLFFLLFIC
jgi:hypothetical protein